MAASPLLEAAAIRVAVRQEVRAAVQEEAAGGPPGSRHHPSPDESRTTGRQRTDLSLTPSYEKARTHVADRTVAGARGSSEKDRETLGNLLSLEIEPR